MYPRHEIFCFILQDEFGCYDGSCVDINIRYDAVPNCPDKSDEMDCETLSTSKENFGTYDKTLTPISDFSDFLKINVSVDIKEIVQIGKK